MSLTSFLRKVFSVRIADISGVGSAAATAAPADGLHRPHPTTNALIDPSAGTADPTSPDARPR